MNDNPNFYYKQFKAKSDGVADAGVAVTLKSTTTATAFKLSRFKTFSRKFIYQIYVRILKD